MVVLCHATGSISVSVLTKVAHLYSVMHAQLNRISRHLMANYHTCQQLNTICACGAGHTHEAGRGTANLYQHLLQSDRNLRWPFLRTLIRCFDTASDLLTAGAATADLRLVCSLQWALGDLLLQTCSIQKIYLVYSRHCDWLSMCMLGSCTLCVAYSVLESNITTHQLGHGTDVTLCCIVVFSWQGI